VSDAPVSEFKARPRDVLEPLFDRVVVLPDAAPDQIGSILVAETAQERPARGVVVAVGPDVKTVAVGDRVLYAHFTGADAEHDGQAVLVLQEPDVYAKVTARAG